MNYSENKIDEYLVKKCKEYDIFICKLPPSTRGVPDRILVKNGFTIFVELKESKLDHTKNKQQQKRLDTINKNGGIALVIHTKEQIDHLTLKLAATSINNHKEIFINEDNQR